MNLKKIGTLFLALTLGMVFMGCSKTKTTEGSTSAPAAGDSTIVLWTFADNLLSYYEQIRTEYKQTHPNFDLQVEWMEGGAMNDRLTVIQMSNGEGAPDLVDVEQGTFPRYMSEDMIMFYPLNSWIDRDKIHEKMVESRNALYKYNGNYYGLECALTPVTLAYRHDIFDQYNLKVPATWDEYKALAVELRKYGHYIGNIGSLETGIPSEVQLFLKAAHADAVGPDGNINITPVFKQILTDIRDMQKNGLLYVAQTNEETWGSFRSNEVVSYICADWSAGVLKQYIPEQAGLWKMAPLPKLTADSARTSCNGGTGLTMMKYTKKDKETLWDFMKWSRVEPKNSAAMYTILGLYPCVYDAMPLVNGPNEYYSNQDVGGLYAELAREMPIQNQAAWRGNFWEFMGQNAYDFYTGAITVDELLEIAVTETEAQM